MRAETHTRRYTHGEITTARDEEIYTKRETPREKDREEKGEGKEQRHKERKDTNVNEKSLKGTVHKDLFSIKEKRKRE